MDIILFNKQATKTDFKINHLINKIYLKVNMYIIQHYEVHKFQGFNQLFNNFTLPYYMHHTNYRKAYYRFYFNKAYTVQ